MHITRAAAIVTAALAAATAGAHEFWLSPTMFHPSTGTPVGLRLMVGDEFPGDPVARNPKKIEKFVVIGPDGNELAVEGKPGAEPAGSVTLAAPGTYIGIYDSHPSFVAIEGPKFEEYLAEKNLHAVIKARSESGNTAKPGREIYSRCAKTIFSVGNDTGAGFDRVVGLRLEIVPGAHPGTLSAGSMFRAKVLFEGKPLSKAHVLAMHAGQSKPVAVTTDDDGFATFSIDGEGMWLIACTHMTAAPATNTTGETADWESTWASLTFEVPPKSATAK